MIWFIQPMKEETLTYTPGTSFRPHPNPQETRPEEISLITIFKVILLKANLWAHGSRNPRRLTDPRHHPVDQYSEGWSFQRSFERECHTKGWEIFYGTWQYVNILMKFDMICVIYCITWQASWPLMPPAQKLDAGRMKIFSVTVLIFLTHSLSFTIGTRASRIRRGIGPAERKTLKRCRDFVENRKRLLFFRLQGGGRGGRWRVKVASVSDQPPFSSLCPDMTPATCVWLDRLQRTRQ